MPISGHEFEKHKNPLRYIIDFLKKNRDAAFTANEIAERVNIDKQIISTTLNLVPLAEVLAMSRRTKTAIKSVTINNVTYYKYNEDFRE